MGIDVRHGANPSRVLAAGFAAGEGAQRTKIQEQSLQAMEARKARKRQQDFQREMLEKQQMFGREMTDKRQAYGLEVLDRQQIHNLNMSELQHLYGLEDISANHGLGRGDFAFKLTAQQKADQEKYQNSLYEIENSEDFTPEEKVEAKRRIMSKMAGIRPIPTRKEQMDHPMVQVAPGVNVPALINSQGMPDVGKTHLEYQKQQWKFQEKAMELAISGETGDFDPEKYKSIMESMTPENNEGASPREAVDGLIDAVDPYNYIGPSSSPSEDRWDQLESHLRKLIKKGEITEDQAYQYWEIMEEKYGKGAAQSAPTQSTPTQAATIPPETKQMLSGLTAEQKKLLVKQADELTDMVLNNEISAKERDRLIMGLIQTAKGASGGSH